jgi:hypothetical protein
MATKEKSLLEDETLTLIKDHSCVQNKNFKNNRIEKGICSIEMRCYRFCLLVSVR